MAGFLGFLSRDVGISRGRLHPTQRLPLQCLQQSDDVVDVFSSWSKKHFHQGDRFSEKHSAQLCGTLLFACQHEDVISLEFLALLQLWFLLKTFEHFCSKCCQKQRFNQHEKHSHELSLSYFLESLGKRTNSVGGDDIFYHLRLGGNAMLWVFY